MNKAEYDEARKTSRRGDVGVAGAAMIGAALVGAGVHEVDSTRHPSESLEPATKATAQAPEASPSRITRNESGITIHVNPLDSVQQVDLPPLAEEPQRIEDLGVHPQRIEDLGVHPRHIDNLDPL